MAENTAVFPFGRNWEEFVASSLDEEQVEAARKHLLDFLERPDLDGKYLLDVGCGSGIHSLAALRARAGRIVSFDVDPVSVAVTEQVRAHAGAPKDWRVLRGSVLDDAFLAGIEPADIVYAWGSLHHTGRMWRAVENAAKLMKPDGVFYLGLYTTTPRSSYWLETKRRYNAAPRWRKRAMELRYALRHAFLPSLLRLENPFSMIAGYKKNRGMAFWTDVKDWLGGYPYEDAKIEEVLRFARRTLGLELLNIKTGESVTEYLFRKR